MPAAGERLLPNLPQGYTPYVVTDDTVEAATGLKGAAMSVSSSPATSSTANTPAIVTSAGTALVANTARKSWSIQNLDTDVLYVRLGAAASSTVFHFLLKGCAVADDGTGGLITDDTWLGLVSVTGTTPRFVVSELT